MQIDFSAAFETVNHQSILCKLYYVSIGGFVLSTLTQFLSNRSQRVMEDGCRSIMINVVSRVPQGRALRSLVFLLYNSNLFFILENKLISYADDYTVMAVLPSLSFIVTVAESLKLVVGKVTEWCDLWGINLHSSNSKTDMIVSRSPTMHPQSPDLTIGGTALMESEDLYILGVAFDSKVIIEKHLRSVYRAASQKFSILRKFWHVFHDGLLLMRCFGGLVL